MRYLRRIPYASEHETGIKGGLETRGWEQRIARRGHGNEGMRATLLIRVYLTAPQLQLCLHLRYATFAQKSQKF